MNRFFLTALSLFTLAAAAWAHSSLVRSEPKAGAVLSAAPNELRIWFTEPIKVGLSTIVVRDAAGKQIDARDLRAEDGEPVLVHLSLPAGLGPGSYRVTWSAVAQDLHVARGSFSFRVSP